MLETSSFKIILVRIVPQKKDHNGNIEPRIKLVKLSHFNQRQSWFLNLILNKSKENNIKVSRGESLKEKIVFLAEVGHYYFFIQAV